MRPDEPPDVESGLEHAIFPLNEFYHRAGLPLPRFDLIAPQTMPQPYRSLLVHDHDMTPTLEAHYGRDIHIEVLGRERSRDAYYREVILRLDGDDRPVEFGVNRITLEVLPPLVRRLVLQEQLPLGHLLRVHEVAHEGRPSAFFRVEADTLMRRAFGLEGIRVLYGRRNTLKTLDGRVFSEVVEILPPDRPA